LAKIFLEIDRAILNEVQANKYFNQHLEGYPSVKLLNNFKRDITSTDTKSPDELWKTLNVDRIGKYNLVWNEAAVALLQYQAGSRFSDLPAWSIAKSRALPILNLCSDAWETYGFEDELREHNYQDLLRGIRGKFRSLHGFLSVYNLQPAKGSESTYSRPLYHKKEKKNGPVQFSEAQQNVRSLYSTTRFTCSHHHSATQPLSPSCSQPQHFV
jgi:hypothetical protein